MYAANHPNTTAVELKCGCTWRHRFSRPEYLKLCSHARFLARHIKADGDLAMVQFERHFDHD